MAEDEDTPDVYQQLAQLGELKARLDEVDAEIGDLIPAVESALDSLQLGVPVSLEIATGERWIEFLSFSKVNKKWRLCLDLSPEDPLDADEWKSTPLSDIPRDRRAFILAEYLPMFLKAAVSAVKQKIEQRQRAIEAAQNLVSMVATYREDEAPKEDPALAPSSSGHRLGLFVRRSLPARGHGDL